VLEAKINTLYRPDPLSWLHQPVGGGFNSHSRQYRGYHGNQLRRTLRPARPVKIEFKQGDLLRLINNDGATPVLLLSVNASGDSDFKAIGLEANAKEPLAKTVGAENTNSAKSGVKEILTWHASYGGEAKQDRLQTTTVFDELTPAGESFTLRASTDVTLWLLVHPSNLLSDDRIAVGGMGGSITFEHISENQSGMALPEPFGDVREEFTIPRGTAKAYTLEEGETVQVIDCFGQQCSDFMALYACTARGYEERGFFGHLNCSDNISAVYEPFGIQAKAAWPAINFFFNSWIDHADNQIQSDEAWSRPGDYVAMEAMTDLTAVSTACPDDVDPINGWNPTDIHVRIYRKNTPVRYAVAYRSEPDAEAILTEHSAFHERTSALTRNFVVARDVWLPESFEASRANQEYEACRSAVTVQDMSSIRKFDVLGPDAEALLQKAMTRDITKLSVNRGIYALMCDAAGNVIDDGTLFRLTPDAFRWCCASDDSGLHLKEIAEEAKLNVWIKSLFSSMPNLAIQGPKSRELMERICFTQPTQTDVSQLRWFGSTVARLHDREGHPFHLTRSGYTGELGYEIFCHEQSAVAIWDAVMEAGGDLGIKPMGLEALNTIRIEAGLMAAGAEFAPDVDAYEAGLAFAVDLNKSDFIGKDALQRNSESPRRVLKGLKFNGHEVPQHGDPVMIGRRQVGTITSAALSPALDCAIAMTRLSVEHANVGAEIETGKLDSHGKRLLATICDIPFVDPTRSRARA